MKKKRVVGGRKKNPISFHASNSSHKLADFTDLSVDDDTDEDDKDHGQPILI